MSAVIICREHGERKQYAFKGPWLPFDEAAAYVPCRHRRCGCPSAKAFYDWRMRHGVIAQAGTVSKADIDAAKRQDVALRKKQAA